MGLTETFQNAAQTAFNAFGDIVKAGTYTVIADDGFTSVSTDYPCSIIPVSNLEEEQNTISFREMIQPNDVIALVLGKTLTVDIKTSNKLTFTPPGSSTDETFTIIDKNIDSAKALYILLLRKL